MERTTSHPGPGMLHRFLLALLVVALGPIAAEAQPFLYVATAGSNAVTVMNGRTMTVIAVPIAVVGEPTAVAVAPDGKNALVASRPSKVTGRVSFIDNVIVEGVDREFNTGAGPVGGVIERNRPLGYILSRDTHSFSVFHVPHQALVDSFCATCSPSSDKSTRLPALMMLTPDESSLYVAGRDVFTRVAFASRIDFSDRPLGATVRNVRLAG